VTTIHAGDITTDCERCISIGAREMANGDVAITTDGGILCAQCLHAEATRIAEANATTDSWSDDQWRVIGSQPHDDGDTCDHCYAGLVTP
jgi:hypothetical protein